MSKKNLEQMIKENLQEAKVKTTPGNSAVPEEGKDPGKGGNDPKAKGKPAPPDKLLTDPKEKLKDLDKVTKSNKAAKKPGPNQGAEGVIKQGSSDVSTKTKVKEDDDAIEFDDEDIIVEDEIEDGEDLEITDIEEYINALDEDELKANFAELLSAVLSEDEDSEDDEEDSSERIGEESGEVVTQIRRRITADDVDVQEDVNAIFAADEDLSEEFKSTASTIFEAAVVAQVNAKLDELEESFKVELSEAIEKHESDLIDRVDDYLDYVIEAWMEKNELAVERGLRTEIAEGFISGLQKLCIEHYVDMPEEKADVMESFSEEIDELKIKLNESIERSIQLQTERDQAVRDSILNETLKNLPDTQAEKLRSLSEGVDFEDADQYASSIQTLKESYFPESSDDNVEYIDDDDVDHDFITEEVDDRSDNTPMSVYSRVLGRQVKR